MSSPPDSPRLPNAFEALPLFPLPRVVLLPHTLLPLHIFEPRYRELVDHCLSTGGVFGLPRLKPDGPDCEDCPPFERVMGLGRIVRHQPLPDGRSNIVVLGVGRARFRNELPAGTASYRVGRCDCLDDILTPTPSSCELDKTIHQLRLAAMQVVHGRDEVTQELVRLLDCERDPAEVVDILAHMSLRDTNDRQAFLELDSVPARADHLLASLTGILYTERTCAEC